MICLPVEPKFIIVVAQNTCCQMGIWSASSKMRSKATVKYFLKTSKTVALMYEFWLSYCVRTGLPSCTASTLNILVRWRSKSISLWFFCIKFWTQRIDDVHQDQYKLKFLKKSEYSKSFCQWDRESNRERWENGRECLQELTLARDILLVLSKVKRNSLKGLLAKNNIGA